jgi:hypothetical protein
MIPQTVPLNEAPDMLGAFDRIVERARSQNAANEAHEASVAVKKAWFCEDFERLLSAGNLRAHVFFARRRAGVKAPSVQEVAWSAVEESTDLQQRFMSLMFFASEGCDVREYAKELRKLVIAQAAEEEICE